jgi:hypothetical protein
MKKMTQQEFAMMILSSIYTALRQSASKIPGATPEFLRRFEETMNVSEAMMLTFLPSMLAEILGAAGVEVEGLDAEAS